MCDSVMQMAFLIFCCMFMYCTITNLYLLSCIERNKLEQNNTKNSHNLICSQRIFNVILICYLNFAKFSRDFVTALWWRDINIFDKPRCKWENNKKYFFKEIGFDIMGEPLGLINIGEFPASQECLSWSIISLAWLLPLWIRTIYFRSK